MSIQNVSSVGNVSFQANASKTAETKIAPKEIKDGKKKLALALAGLATAGAVTVGIALAVKKGKVPSELSMDNFKKIGNFEKGKAFVKGKPFTGTIDVVNKNDKFQMEYVDGVLKSSTKSEKMPEFIIKQHEKAGLTGEKFEYITKSKKIYTEQNGVKAIERQVRKPTADKWVMVSKTTIEDDAVIKKYNTLVGELEDVALKQEDGTWIATTQEAEAIGRGKYNIHTIDKKTGRKMFSEERDFAKDVVLERQKPATPQEQDLFKF